MTFRPLKAQRVTLYSDGSLEIVIIGETIILEKNEYTSLEIKEHD